MSHRSNTSNDRKQPGSIPAGKVVSDLLPRAAPDSQNARLQLTAIGPPQKHKHSKRLTKKLSDSHWQGACACNRSALPQITLHNAPRGGCSLQRLVRRFPPEPIVIATQRSHGITQPHPTLENNPEPIHAGHAAPGLVPRAAPGSQDAPTQTHRNRTAPKTQTLKTPNEKAHAQPLEASVN